MKKYGFGIISLPKDVETIPSWLLPFIDISAMIDSNVRNALILLEVLGIQVVKTDAVDRMSNIVSF
jgi:hypothetical protein